ncbi:MAG: hypothetical protein QM737_08685 [Ferruginibacter sp.]
MPPPIKNTLEKGEFAIKNGAEFKISSLTDLLIEKDGTFVVTFKLKNAGTNLQVNTGTTPIPIKKGFDPCGVFKLKNLINGKLNAIKLQVTSGGEVLLKSSGKDFDLKTNGQKGEHGNTALSKEKKKKKA